MFAINNLFAYNVGHGTIKSSTPKYDLNKQSIFLGYANQLLLHYLSLYYPQPQTSAQAPNLL